ncbi:MAG: hypothetical protein ACI91C_001841 [Burkholderiaceae bacterium]|jgi:hypothetical protein
MEMFCNKIMSTVLMVATLNGCSVGGKTEIEHVLDPDSYSSFASMDENEWIKIEYPNSDVVHTIRPNDPGYDDIIFQTEGLKIGQKKRILPKAGSIRKTRDGNFVVSRLSYLGTASYIVDDMINKGSNYYRCYNPLFMNLEIEKNYPLLKKTYEEIQKCISQEDWLIN